MWGSIRVQASDFKVQCIQGSEFKVFKFSVQVVWLRVKDVGLRDQV